jgi:hypothetical protein
MIMSISNAMLMAGSNLPPLTFVYDYTGADQTLVVPLGYYNASVKLWGAGSDGGVTRSTTGAAGGFAKGSFATMPGETLVVVVGEAGFFGRMTSTYGGGGASGDPSGGGYGCSAGGGRSAIRRGGSDISTAGGAGGNGRDAQNATGVGGGLTGGQGYSNGGYGGTQSAGGAAGGYPGIGSAAGTQYQGGVGGSGGSGGGGGFYGGGGASSGAGYYAQGGGGSSYIALLTSGVTEAGSGTTPGGSTDPDYQAGIGIGRAAGVPSRAGHGRVIITLTM